MVDYSQYKMQDGEDLYSYLARIQQARAGGILGTQGLMDMPAQERTPQAEMTSQPLGEVTQNCAEGYVWNGSACVPINSSDGEGEQVKTKPATLQQMIDAKTGRSFDPANIFGMFGPLGSVAAAGIDIIRDNELKNALAEKGYTDEQIDIAMQNPEYVAQQIYSGRVGSDPVDGVYRPSDAGKWSMGGGIVGNIFEGLFGSNTAQPAISSYGAAPTLREQQALPYLGMGAGLLSDQGSASNRQYYISSTGDVRDVTGRSAETLAGLEAVAGGAFKTPDWYSDDSDSGSSSTSWGSPSKTYTDTQGLSSTGSWDFNRDQLLTFAKKYAIIIYIVMRKHNDLFRNSKQHSKASS